MNIIIPENVGYILNKLHNAGYEAYIVGGSVRDALLNQEPKDYDITTNAEPSEVKSIFPKTFDTCLKHGTVTVRYNHESYEVTTYRVDGTYEDHRRPKEVTFTKSLAEDLLRRDFTINAMAYNEEEGLIDMHGGLEDLNNCVIRAVGDARKRFDEDALRILRAMRFAGQLSFDIEDETLQAMKEKAILLKDISAERIREELTKLLISDNPELLANVGYKLGITKIILPEFDRMLETTQENPHHCYDVGTHSLVAVKNIEADDTLRWIMLLHDVGKPETKTMDENGTCHFYRHAEVGTDIAVAIFRRLRFDNETIRKAKTLIFYHDYNWGDKVSDRVIRRAASRVGVDNMRDLFKVHRADVLAQSDLLREEKLSLLDGICKRFEELLDEKQAMSLKDLAINGNDLIKLGFKPGPEIGETLNSLFEEVLENPELNTRETLLLKLTTQ